MPALVESCGTRKGFFGAHASMTFRRAVWINRSKLLLDRDSLMTQNAVGTILLEGERESSAKYSGSETAFHPEFQEKGGPAQCPAGGASAFAR